VTYWYDAGSRVLRRYLYEGTPSQTWMPLLEQVEPNPGNVPLFTFLDGNGSPTTVRGDIRTVLITLTVLEPAGRSKTVERTYSSRVRLRNIGLGG
jgi:hypothetical protein